MKLRDLKAGMTVVMRNGSKYRVFTDCALMSYPTGIVFANLNKLGFVSGDGYDNDNMTYGSKEFDIMKVHDTQLGSYLLSTVATGGVIWERISELEDGDVIEIIETGSRYIVQANPAYIQCIYSCGHVREGELRETSSVHNYKLISIC